MKIWKCDRCGKEFGMEISSPYMAYPKDWFLIRVFSKAQSKGGKSKEYHFCKKCKEEIFKD